ncbi:MAG: hypothetical protein P4L16_05345 [Chlamydiales bacterium]|nr:hypothetical protein [Chlamydiales bacterium]
MVTPSTNFSPNLLPDIKTSEPEAIEQWVQTGGELAKILTAAQNAIHSIETEPSGPDENEKRRVYKNLSAAINGKKAYYQEHWIIGGLFKFIKAIGLVALFGGDSISKAENFIFPVCSAGRIIQMNKIGSEGIVVAPEGSFAYSHASTVPPEYYLKKYPNVDDKFCAQNYLTKFYVTSMEGMNMDRGAVGSRYDGTHFACLADGVGGGGIFSMHAAQGFCEQAIRELDSNPSLLTSKNPDKRGKELFERLVNAPGPAQIESAGAATMVVAATETRSDGFYNINGAALGDSVVIHVDGDKHAATQLNVVKRKEGSKSDSGGQILAGTGLEKEENICGFSKKVKKEDLVILASDGLTDNIVSIDLLPLILYNPFFDSQKEPRAFSKDLPDRKELEALLQEERTPTPEQAVTRLNNYVEWVIFQRRQMESEGLALEIQAGGAKNARMDGLQRILKSPEAPCGKTDDVMIIAFNAG